jgi:hypothetical protein
LQTLQNHKTNITMNITDELIETLQGIKDGKEAEFQADGQWFAIRPGRVFSVLSQEYPIRLKPFVPTPPEGYRLVRRDECSEAPLPDKVLYWSGGGKWQPMINWFPYEFVAVPIAPPEPPKPQYVPWTARTFPMDAPVWVRRKHFNGFEYLLVTISENGAYTVPSGPLIDWERLLSEWVQKDGKPCGTLCDAKTC